MNNVEIQYMDRSMNWITVRVIHSGLNPEIVNAAAAVKRNYPKYQVRAIDSKTGALLYMAP